MLEFLPYIITFIIFRKMSDPLKSMDTIRFIKVKNIHTIPKSETKNSIFFEEWSIFIWNKIFLTKFQSIIMPKLYVYGQFQVYFEGAQTILFLYNPY